MFQPEVKLEFIRRYCNPRNGWMVFVDIDASEEGRTGVRRTRPASRKRQREMKAAAKQARNGLEHLKVTVGGSRANWFESHGLPALGGDRDIVAFHHEKRLCLIAEVEGDSAGQPEQKLYKAIGQIVVAASVEPPPNWERRLFLVVHGDKIGQWLASCKALERLGVSAVSLRKGRRHDTWYCGEPT